MFRKCFCGVFLKSRFLQILGCQKPFPYLGRLQQAFACLWIPRGLDLLQCTMYLTLHNFSLKLCSTIVDLKTYCSAVQCSAVQCSAVQCNAVQCSAKKLHCIPVQCNSVQYMEMHCRAAFYDVVHQAVC